MDNRGLSVKIFRQYLKERFPVFGILLYCASSFYSSLYFGKVFGEEKDVTLVSTILGLIVIFLSLLHLRILDEFKDYEKDRVAYPERLLSRGTITLGDLKKILYVIIFIEFWISVYLGTYQIIIWVLIIAYSLLLMLEPFAPQNLTKKVNFYLVLHELILPLYLLYGIFLQIERLENVVKNYGILIIYLMASMFSTIAFEIGRKTWSRKDEKDCADSYTKIWGAKKTVVINQVYATLSTSMFIYIYVSINANVVYLINNATVYLVYIIAEIIFVYDSSRKNSRLVKKASALYLIAQFTNSALCFYMTL